MNKNFCVIPWVQLASKPIGTARVCCLMTNSKDKNQGVIRNSLGQPFNLGRDDFDLIKNGDKAKEVRLFMLEGKRHPDCITCWTKEDMGSPSKRTVSNKMYQNEFDYDLAKSCTDLEGNTTWQPSYWDLRFGNLCNLKCIMCHPASSSQWYEDYVLLNGSTTFTDTGTKVNLNLINGRYKDSGEYDWWDNEGFWRRLEEKIPFLKQVYLVGGEPMLIEPHYDFLEKIISMKKAGDVILEYDTNLTNVHARALKLWKNFKKIWLRISIDDYGEQFNYVRYPAKWDQITKNLDKVYNTIPNVKLDFTITWQLLTSYTTPNLLRYLTKFKNSNISIRILSSPDYFDVAILPHKDKLINLYENFEKENTGIQVSHLINYLKFNSEQKDDKIKVFLEKITKLDQIRKTSWMEVFPELKDRLL